MTEEEQRQLEKRADDLDRELKYLGKEKETLEKDKEDLTKKVKRQKTIIILLVIIIIILIICKIIIIIHCVTNHTQTTSGISGISSVIVPEDVKDNNPLRLKHEGGAMAIDETSLQDLVDDLLKTPPGYISLNFRNTAISKDGEHFDCFIANDPSNNFDVFLTLYSDATRTDQLYLSGLISPGEAIYTFRTERTLDYGMYDQCVLVISEVSEDGTQLISQTNIALTLQVGDYEFAEDEE